MKDYHSDSERIAALRSRVCGSLGAWHRKKSELEDLKKEVQEYEDNHLGLSVLLEKEIKRAAKKGFEYRPADDLRTEHEVHLEELRNIGEGGE